ncbi:MAG TPA: DUF502 domain-containing protein [Steroidobacteraceae bacterium]|nr:DUF502 domain-containing protein [Steroidobacteraceae bacterium]HRX88204.1 DUF502 domain-containing protein [Steroidobacteraceae bacterium]
MSDQRWIARVRKYLIAGVLVWMPILATLFVVRFLVGLMDITLKVLPAGWRPEALLGFPLPGLGAVLAFVVLMITGFLGTNLIGRQVVGGWEGLMRRIPFVRTVYGGVKTFAETLFSDTGKSFKKVVAIEYPRREIWSVGFLVTENPGEIVEHASRELVGVFVPTTPNPTSGFIVFVPREHVIEMAMTVDQAMKMILTLGVVSPIRTGTSGVIAPNPARPETGS